MVRPVRSTSANRINNFWLDKKLDAVEDLGNTMLGVVVEVTVVSFAAQAGTMQATRTTSNYHTKSNKQEARPRQVQSNQLGPHSTIAIPL